MDFVSFVGFVVDLSGLFCRRDCSLASGSYVFRLEVGRLETVYMAASCVCACRLVVKLGS